MTAPETAPTGTTPGTPAKDPSRARVPSLGEEDALAHDVGERRQRPCGAGIDPTRRVDDGPAEEKNVGMSPDRIDERGDGSGLGQHVGIEDHEDVSPRRAQSFVHSGGVASVLTRLDEPDRRSGSADAGGATVARGVVDDDHFRVGGERGGDVPVQHRDELLAAVVVHDDDRDHGTAPAVASTTGRAGTPERSVASRIDSASPSSIHRR